MAAIDTVDSIEIRADASRIFGLIADYSQFHTWFPNYRCVLLEAGATGPVHAGSRVEHIIGKPPAVIRFIRTVRKVVPGLRLEETYDEGPMRGTGIWSFQQKGEVTTVSYHCAVSAQSLMFKLVFLLSGPRTHNMTYQKILRALKQRCENG